MSTGCLLPQSLVVHRQFILPKQEHRSIKPDEHFQSIEQVMTRPSCPRKVNANSRGGELSI
eukprot:7617560-Pyramimonas_sp.AAC.1